MVPGLDFSIRACPNGVMDKDAIDPMAMREALSAEKAALLNSSETTASKRTPVTLDQQSVGRLSRMDALQGQAMAQAEEVRRQQRLRLIDAALKRIDDEEYGYCVSCGDDIPAKRLHFDPAAARCIECAT